MDDQRAGQVLRCIRHRKGWRQQDLARSCGRLGHDGRPDRAWRDLVRPAGQAPTLAEASALGSTRSFGGRAPISGACSTRATPRMHESMADISRRADGWVFEPEVSFSIYGERGVIDILAWHPEPADALDHRAQDRDRRSQRPARNDGSTCDVSPARSRARYGWKPLAVAHWVVVADSRTNRRARVALMPMCCARRCRWTAGASGRGCGTRRRASMRSVSCHIAAA